MREKAQEWLCREVRNARMAQGRAENRPGVTQEELERLENKVEVLDWLLEMIGRVGGGWISVKDRLPEESDGTVLVCFPDVSPYNLKEPFMNAKHDKRIRTAVYSQFSKTWYIGDMCGVGREYPIYWKPLPSAPKEE